jgi:serine/threonine protein kinase
MSLKNFGPLTVIGKGSFGTVYRGVRKADGKAYAIKAVAFDKLKDKEQSNALNEVRVLACI